MDLFNEGAGYEKLIRITSYNVCYTKLLRPDMTTSAESWILAGGGHHTAFSNILTADMIRDWAEMVGIEFVSIGKGTTVPSFRNELRWNAAAWR